MFGALLVALTAACSTSVESPPSASIPRVAVPPVAPPVAVIPKLVSGIDLHHMDASARPQDDLYRHVNGSWLNKTEIPADKSAWGSFYELRDATLPQLRAIIESAMKETAGGSGADAQKIGDLYSSFMDVARLETLGLAPLQNEFARVAAIGDKQQIPALIAHFNRFGITAPYNLRIGQDARDATKYVPYLYQNGLGLPDRDYYLKDDDVRLKEVRGKYQAHIEKMLRLAGDQQAAANARKIVALETALAKVQWTKVENRNPVKTYNKVALNRLDALAPGYGWQPYLRDAGIAGKADYVIVAQPSYFAGFNRVLKSTPLAVWKAYFQWHLLSSYAPFLPKAYDEQHFAFNSTVLRGVPQQQARWKRAVALTEKAIGEGLGKLYVARHFPPEHKARMEKLVANLLAAYRESIDTLDWMSSATKKEAQAKLATFRPKIGYPDTWRDYSKMTIQKNDLIGNVQRATAFEYQRNIDKLGQPIDRDEWRMTPQTVNAYYNPSLNEIVFPAAILQPPFFNAHADDAVNYGGIGAVIGHEISHGFDDWGSQYDGLGNLRNWWTREDHEKFAAKTKELVAQYSAFSPVPGYHVNGELTLGENIADNAGVAIAHKAYKLSLQGKDAPVIDGMTGDQRFYAGFGQIWRGKLREQEMIVRIKTDPHSPAEVRANGTLRNQPGFYDAYGVKEQDQMYLAPEKRVLIW